MFQHLTRQGWDLSLPKGSRTSLPADTQGVLRALWAACRRRTQATDQAADVMTSWREVSWEALPRGGQGTEIEAGELDFLPLSLKYCCSIGCSCGAVGDHRCGGRAVKGKLWGRVGSGGETGVWDGIEADSCEYGEEGTLTAKPEV